MSNSTAAPDRPLRGIAALFTDEERKALFRKYIKFLLWIEAAILVSCWLYQLGDRGHDNFGPIEVPFPWKVYFLVAFLAPVAISFLVGTVIVGFNRYFGDSHSEGEGGMDGVGYPGMEAGRGRVQQMKHLMAWVQRLPFLALLLLLCLGALFIYKLDAFLSFLAVFGQRSGNALLTAAVVILVIGCLFALLLIVLNYRLRKRSMDYQYKSEMAERFGLIILEDNTVLNGQGKLLVHGNSGKKLLPLLPVESPPSEPEEVTPEGGALSTTIELKTTG